MSGWSEGGSLVNSTRSLPLHIHAFEVVPLVLRRGDAMAHEDRLGIEPVAGPAGGGSRPTNSSAQRKGTRLAAARGGELRGRLRFHAHQRHFLEVAAVLARPAPPRPGRTRWRCTRWPVRRRARLRRGLPAVAGQEFRMRADAARPKFLRRRPGEERDRNHHHLDRLYPSLRAILKRPRALSYQAEGITGKFHAVAPDEHWKPRAFTSCARWRPSSSGR